MDKTQLLGSATKWVTLRFANDWPNRISGGLLTRRTKAEQDYGDHAQKAAGPAERGQKSLARRRVFKPSQAALLCSQPHQLRVSIGAAAAVVHHRAALAQGFENSRFAGFVCEDVGAAKAHWPEPMVVG